MDNIDNIIICCLKENSRISWKEIGEKVYMSGQAVALRVRQLEDKGIIQKYTIQIKSSHRQFITIFMNSNELLKFEHLVHSFDEVEEFHKIAGEGCYMIKSAFENKQLQEFLTAITIYARYQLSESIVEIKA